MTDQAALQVDPNMPPIEEEVIEASPVDEIKNEPKIESAPIEQEETPAEPVEEENGVQKRINKITADKYAAERKAEELERKLESLQKPQEADSSKPTLEQFDYDNEQYTEALIAYGVKQAAQQIRQEEAAARNQQAQEVKRKSFGVKVAEFSTKAPDYQEVISALPELQQEVVDVLMEAGPEMAYYLGKHLDEADVIASSSPMVAAMKLGAIQAKLSVINKPAPTSAAPEPIETVSSGGIVNKDLGDMSMDEIYNR